MEINLYDKTSGESVQLSAVRELLLDLAIALTHGSAAETLEKITAGQAEQVAAARYICAREASDEADLLLSVLDALEMFRAARDAIGAARAKLALWADGEGFTV